MLYLRSIDVSQSSAWLNGEGPSVANRVVISSSAYIQFIDS